MRRPLLAIYRQNYERNPDLYLEQLLEEKARWTPERLAPLVGEENAAKVAAQLSLPPLWLYIDDRLYHWYDSVDEARDDMQLLGERGDPGVQHLRPRPSSPSDLLHFLLQFSAGL